MEWKKDVVEKVLETRGNRIESALKKVVKEEGERIVRFEVETALRWMRKVNAATAAFEKA
jgi:hypothetical protein